MLSNEEFAAKMEARRNLALEMLAKVHREGRPSLPSIGQRPGPEPTKITQDYPEVEEDPINDVTTTGSAERNVTMAPESTLAGTVNTVEPVVVSDVPVCEARGAEGFDAPLPVQSTLAGVDGAKVHFANVVKQAHQNVRSEGDLASSIAIAIGQDATESTEATVTAVTSRIAGARIAVQKGALASQLPRQGMDVRVCALRDAMSAQRQFPTHTPVYVPSGLSDAAGAALVSLLVGGGPAAYVWEYPAGIGDAGLMPAVMRWKWPGGSDRLLVISEHDRDWLVPFGGAALTADALIAVENYYRAEWGDSIFDDGWRAAMALSGVYVEPEAMRFNFGRDVQVKQTKRRYLIDGAEVAAADAWPGPADPGERGDDPELRGIFTHIPPAVLSELGAPLWRLWVEHHDNWDGERPNIDMYMSMQLEVRGIMYLDTGGTRWLAHWADLTTPEMREADPRLVELVHLARRTQVHAVYGDGIAPPPRRGDIDPRQMRYRSVFGSSDVGVMLIPRLRITSVLAVLAGISVTVPARPVERFWDDGNMKVVFESYASRLHFLFTRSLSDQFLEPAVMRVLPLSGAVGMLGVPEAYRCLVLPKHLDGVNYPFENLECLENGGILRSFNDTPFAGMAVPGSWDMQGGLLVVAADGNSYAAIDSAARVTWLTDGRIDVHTRLRPGKRITVILNGDQLPNPFAIPRFVSGTRGVERLSIEAGRGLNALQAGRAMGAYIWSSF
ncbi:hypothetical protein [Aspergillus foetidus dsRNA mycovirus]|uniref:Uncharacterized protein n=1 Tax=Aspergillus foetidus dsRNA mycovirus TaxID=1087068 RepID=I7HPJ2_9VIRU|nr:hypothetical protein [Aspergillus foetidus dsRNA mycovirus]CCD33022.1 hypothetical protein [Aspergillus foetidus dsRNA mycovirus]